MCVHIYVHIYIYTLVDDSGRRSICKAIDTYFRPRNNNCYSVIVGGWMGGWVGGRCVSLRPPSVFDVQSDVSSAGSYIPRTRSRCGSSSLEDGVVDDTTGVVGSGRGPTPDATVGFCRSHCRPNREPSSALLLRPPRGCRRGLFVDLLITIIIIIIILLQNSNHQHQHKR